MIFDKEQTKKEYDELVKDLNYKYFCKVCDIFDEAKNNLKNEVKNLLGDEYKKLDEQIKDKHKKIDEVRQNFDNDADTIRLKGELQIVKEKLLMSQSENEKNIAKIELNNILSQITKRNLENFSICAKYKREIDDLKNKANLLLNEHQKTLEDKEKEIIGLAKKKSVDVIVGYKSEIEALSRCFDITDYSIEIPFIKEFNLSESLINFDKNTAEENYKKKIGHNYECDGDCSHCMSKPKLDEKCQNIFHSHHGDEQDN